MKKKKKPTLGDSESVDPRSLTWSWASVVLQNFTGIRYLLYLRLISQDFRFTPSLF